jgi:hypothetical protein
VLGHKRARTEILDDHSGILEIDHAGGQLMGWKARRWDWNNSAPQISGTVHIYRGLHAGLHVFSNHLMMSSQFPVDEAVTCHAPWPWLRPGPP